MRKLANNLLCDVTNRLNGGESSRSIAQALNVSKSSVNNFRNISQNPTPKSKGGAPSKLTPREKREIVKLVIIGEAKTAVDATKIVNKSRDKPISAHTIRRVLKEANLKATKKVKKPKLTANHKKARLNWAMKHKEWTEDDWKRVIWSDETKINRFSSDGIEYCWIRPEEKLSEKHIKPTVKFGGGNIMIWGCMTFAGVGGLALIEGNMNADQYVQILDNKLTSTIDALSILPDFPPRSDLIFQQDNDPKHTSNKAKTYMTSKGIQTMKWPAQSPDLNPIEHLWSQLKNSLSNYNEPPKGYHQLWQRVQEQWSKVEVESCRTLIRSMPERIEAVLKAKGGNTRF